MTFYTMVAYGSFTTFLTIYAKSIGIENAAAFFTVYAITLLVTRPMTARRLDMHGPKGLIIAGFAFFISAFIVVAMLKNYLMLMIVAILFGIGLGMMQPTFMALSFLKVPSSRQAVANSTMLCALDLGLVFGSLGLGILAKYLSFPTIYLLIGVFALIPAIWFLIFEMKQQYLSKYNTKDEGTII